MINALIAKRLVPFEIVPSNLQSYMAFGQSFSKLTSQTINFCDNVLSAKIEESAKSGKMDFYLYLSMVKDSKFIDTAKQIKEVKQRDFVYSCFGDEIHIPTLINYLRAYSYTVNTRGWFYDNGTNENQSGICIIIKWNE